MSEEHDNTRQEESKQEAFMRLWGWAMALLIAEGVVAYLKPVAS